MVRRPLQRYPKSPGYSRRMTPDNLPDPQLDPIAFEQLIKNRGLKWKHEKGTPCPNVDDMDTQQHDPNCECCTNGIIYFDPQCINGLFQQNKLERMYEVQGVWDIGEAVVTYSAYADDKDGNAGYGCPVDIQHFDRLTLLDYEFRWQQLIEHSPTGIDRLRYPALSMNYLATKDKEYFVDKDFIINEDGNIKWLGQNQPGYDQLNDRGEVYTIVYSARPVFLVVHLVHEVRATKTEDPIDGEVKAVRLPQQVLLRRDYLVENKSDSTGSKSGNFPRSGGNIIPG